jgi:diguanylate cyclase (GGDEF)-like protein
LITVVVLAAFRDALTRETNFARKDPLTGLTNGRFFRRLLRGELERSRRYAHVLSLAYIDLDNFKSVNDRMGHAAGDALLKEVGELLRTSSRSTDTAARLAGDEFALLMPETGQDVAIVAVERLRDRLQDHMRTGGWDVTSSIGLVTYSDPRPARSQHLRRPTL